LDYYIIITRRTKEESATENRFICYETRQAI